MSNHIAVKCTYNDGGEGKRVGFYGPCSNETISRNIQEGRIWCNNSDCADYYNNNFIGHKPECPCYESGLFVNWLYGAGWYHNGKKRDTPIKISGTDIGKYAIFTTRFPDQDIESKRKIVGFYKIATIIDNEDEETFVIGDIKYRIRLSINLSKKLNFWEYYHTENTKFNARWDTGLIRYVNDDQMGAILNKIKLLIDNPDDKLMIDQILKNDFCNNILKISSRMKIIKI